MELGPAVVLLSGGMDSAVALYWAMCRFDPITAITFEYGQQASQQELESSSNLVTSAPVHITHKVIQIPTHILASVSSILGRAPIDQYTDVQEAIAKTASDKSYIPLRNALFITLAAHHLLAKYKEGGAIIVGTRSRSDGAGGYPDCTLQFARDMTIALSQGAGVSVSVLDPLNMLHLDRTGTILLSNKMPGCLQALKHTVSCFAGTRCGRCLPCLRRAQAFERANIKDPADID